MDSGMDTLRFGPSFDEASIASSSALPMNK